jgi:phage I-like protein
VKKRYPSAIKTPKSKQRHQEEAGTPATEFTAAFYEIPEIALEEVNGRYTSSFQVLPEGKFVHPWYGDLDFSAPVLRAFKRNFDKRILGTDIMVDEGHARQKALGWFRGLHHGKKSVGEVEYAGLFAEVEWTALGREYLEGKIYKYFSAEVGSYTDPEGNKTENVLLGGGLTNRPFFKQMPAVRFEDGQAEDRFVIGLFGDDHWRFSEPDNAAGEGAVFNAHYHDESHGEEVIMEELLESINEALGTSFADGDAAIVHIADLRATAEFASKFRTTFTALGFEFKESDDPVAVVAREFKSLRDTNNSLDQRIQSVEGRLAEAEFDKIFNDNLRVGKVLPKQQDSLLKLFKADRKLFDDLMANQEPVVDMQERGHTGDSAEPGSEGQLSGEAASAETKRYLTLAGGRQRGGN